MNPIFVSHFAKHLEDMIQFKEALGYSKSSYEKFFVNFDRFCFMNFPYESILTRDLVMQWARLHPSENANGLKRRMIAVRELGKYLNTVGIQAYVIPTEIIGNFKPFVPYLYTDRELSAFFKASDRLIPHKLSPFRHYIVPVIFRLIYCCGLRPSEGIKIQCADINLRTGELYIRETKMHRDRTIVMSSDMLILCKNYEYRISTICKNRKYFFPHPDRTAYSVSWLQDQFRKCWGISGITDFHGGRPRVYDFRHNYATRLMMKWVEEGKDLYTWLPYLSAYMGHADFSATSYYIHLIPEHLTKSSAINWSKFTELIPEVHQ